MHQLPLIKTILYSVKEHASHDYQNRGSYGGQQTGNACHTNTSEQARPAIFETHHPKT